MDLESTCLPSVLCVIVKSGQAGSQGLGDQGTRCENLFAEGLAGVRGHAWSLEESRKLLVRELGVQKPNLRRIGVEVNLESGGRSGGLPQDCTARAPQLGTSCLLARRLGDGADSKGLSEEKSTDPMTHVLDQRGLKSEVSLCCIFLSFSIFLMKLK